MTAAPREIEAAGHDGHRWKLIARVPASPRAALLWLPALGVAARHYEAFADALAAHGIAVVLHEWRGNGRSSLRPSRACDWGYREILTIDLPASQQVLCDIAPGIPSLIGGHSLGGQLACCHAALHPHAFARVWLVASGMPWWRSFPAPLRYALPLVYRFLPWLARRHGVLPGRRVGFGGTEARGLIADWARVGLSNRYAAKGLDADLEAGLAQLSIPVDSVVLANDWMAPASSMRALTAKMAGETRLDVLSAAALGARADHFSWMKTPAAVAARLVRDTA
ncbi:alpha/beta fold hydrolase [Stenotrophomonas sp. HITSZ_GD]|uniref:alpha/beta hydrolase family protein n=1 Tax=Stenotrophomonas sp. HITSZ_GD TaxID=3037248 RepID=UPI00240D334E|nr:alpha/beta fold hydrolase [Stenotrophomonas sp. HITSZ_GD]MDG2526901.1 alpha/beta fold hydrolase [Stenotrophomonas sp. HITSZ_GD]